MADVHDVSPLAEVLGEALYHFDRMRPLLPTYGHLLVSALFPIWIGAHASLQRPSSAAKPPKKDEDKGDDTEDEDDDEEEAGPAQKMEGLEPSDALMFPLTAGLTLGGLYLVIKWLEDPAILNKILSFYFSQMGIFFRRCVFEGCSRVFQADGQVRHSPLPGIFGRIPLPGKILSLLWSTRNASYQRLQLRLHVRGIIDGKGLIGLLDLFSGLFALGAVGYFAFITKPWWLTNFLGFCFSYGALQFMSPSTFWTGTLILGSLFFYDIYFVFFTPLMVTVATKLDVPIKLLFPRPAGPNDDPTVQALAMLGLGDVVIPGMMAGLALRFDLFLYYHRKGIQKAQIEESESIVKPQYQAATGSWGERFWAPTRASQIPEVQPPYHDARAFSKTYFKASIVGYVLGMVTTLLAMQYSNHAQPALLYLVPGVLISLWALPSSRDEDEDEEKPTNEKDAQSDEEKKNEPAQENKSLFMRILSGDLKALKAGGSSSNTQDKDQKAKQDTPSEDEGTQASSFEKDGAEKKKDGDDKKGKQEKKEDDLDLVTFSLSFRRGAASKKDSQIDSTNLQKDEISITPVDGRDEEPPAKRRRGSPRKK
ncbi:Peptidase A22B signal peptide peptidase [Penicillium hetheringtonii]|uniref:Peptidase A22B signal peptide peptidase n=1 Tax=Penicillium hetheringtonii TaxID=911720 RepID=A0AAD6E529_9EURO|nr:Peptidase A22B signal peptide peptidase [Penicillium hetheringtonii]